MHLYKKTHLEVIDSNKAQENLPGGLLKATSCTSKDFKDFREAKELMDEQLPAEIGFRITIASDLKYVMFFSVVTKSLFHL